MEALNQVAINAITKGLKDDDHWVRLEAIHSAVHLNLRGDPTIQSRLHQLVEDRIGYVGGLAAVALMEPVVSEQEPLGNILVEYYQKFPYTATICYLGYLCWMAASLQIPISFQPETFDNVVLGKGNEKVGTQQFKRILDDVVALYLLPYWLALSRHIEANRKHAETGKQHKRFVGLVQVKDVGDYLYQKHKDCLVWILAVLPLMARTGQGTALGAQVLSEAGRLGELIKIRTWLQSLTGYGDNVIDALYSLPEDLSKRCDFLVKLMENGPEDGDMSTYWWTVASAIEKLGDPIYRGDPIVCKALLAKLKDFIPAERAYETKKVGRFEVMYVPTWPHGEKGIYIQLANALAVVADKSVADQLKQLLGTSPYPEVIVGSLQRIEARLNASVNSYSDASKEEAGKDERIPGEDEFSKGMEQKQRGNIDAAIRWLQASVRINPASCNAWYNLGFCWIEKEKYDAALDCLKRALELEPDAVDIMANVVSLYLMVEDIDKALELSERALKLDPNNEYGWLAKAQTILYMGDEERAVRCIEEGLLRCPLGLGLLDRLKELL